ncbi:phosphatase PAP2 family protein [Candidatus Neptunochlamydia vexilliferae]|uniref:Phosphatidic acid phosphatase type 2/haloperoxidase domain-containing protein n=1 Tax=Candidatus Neptunichlamydia vexilliferae TaxID=1651774 RepID=A0ABS0AXH9_9BACT|nr:phosphatase PAP2 family protein [Candidatus Neptunochlamydia vexilliferae]MBF5058846.1 hypothetical protein [Candidatus Neptunochlamydia vexilliferae]
MNHLNLRTPFRKALFFVFLALIAYFFVDPHFLALTDGWRPLMKTFTLLIFPPLHLALWGGLFLYMGLRKKKWSLPLFKITMAQGMVAGCVRIIKILVGRARPDIFIKKGIYGFYGFNWSSHYHSFPSGHSATAFALATSLSLLFPRFSLRFFTLALLFSLSRFLLFKHYLSDILGAAALGVVVASATHLIINKIIARVAHKAF